MNLDLIKQLGQNVEVNFNENFAKHALDPTKFLNNVLSINKILKANKEKTIDHKNPISYFFADCPTIEQFLNEFSANSNADQYFVISSLLGTVSTCISKYSYYKISDNIKRPNLYMVGIAPPKFGKTPLMQNIFIKIYGKFFEGEEFYFQNITLEMAQAVLKKNRFLCLASDEINGLFDLSLYSPQQRGQYESFYNTAFSNGRFTLASLSNQDNMYKEDINLSIFGFMQPDFLTKIFSDKVISGSGSGFANRILFARYFVPESTRLKSITAFENLNFFVNSLKKLKNSDDNFFEFNPQDIINISAIDDLSKIFYDIAVSYDIDLNKFATPKIQEQIFKLSVIFEAIYLADNELLSKSAFESFKVSQKSIGKALLFYQLYFFPCYCQTFSEAIQNRHLDSYNSEATKQQIIAQAKEQVSEVKERVRELMSQGVESEKQIIEILKAQYPFVTRDMVNNYRRAIIKAEQKRIKKS